MAHAVTTAVAVSKAAARFKEKSKTFEKAEEPSAAKTEAAKKAYWLAHNHVAISDSELRHPVRNYEVIATQMAAGPDAVEETTPQPASPSELSLNNGNIGCKQHRMYPEPTRRHTQTV